MNVVRTDTQSSPVPVCLSYVCPPPLSPAPLPAALLFLNQVNLKGFSLLLLFFCFLLHAALWTLHSAEDLTNCTVDQLRDIASVSIHLLEEMHMTWGLYF